ncbi:MAG: 4-hydroxy-tetrahydrodipicolinate synthase [Rickettsiales bacterium]|jgi:4-hydroxy-tetrahydrodipicolinate synthase|nr:4-hydroxy-tetrahydrodipicolinate synthase [Rickettsiales bacterium]
MFEGLGTAIITPFKKQKLDLIAFEKLLNYQIKNGVKNIIVCGTTGEASTLSDVEQSEIIATAVSVCKNKVKVIAGASSSNTDTSIDLAKRNKKLGADGILVAVPPYNKPMQDGMYLHYKTIAEKSKIPVVLYNVPGRTSRDMSDETIARLSQLPNIVALKDATGDLSRVATAKIKVKNGFTLLSGEDATAVGFNAMGGRGVISVSSNVAPKLCADLQEATFKGEYEKAVKIQDKLIKLHKVMFVESNPIPVKYACSLLGYGDGSVRLPLTESDEDTKKKIEEVLKELKLIK